VKKNVQKQIKARKEIKTHGNEKKGIEYINKHFNIISFILIALTGIIVYSNSFDCSFHFDDQNNIVENNIIQSFSNFSSMNFWLNPGRQLSFFSFAINYHFNKLDVFGYHLVNIIIHFITGIFSFLLIKLILNQLKVESVKLKDNHPLPLLSKEGKKGWFFELSTVNWIALFSALLFIVHPLQTQAVTYIVQRMASMAAMFYVISIYLYALGRIEHTQKYNISKAIIFYMFGLFSGFLGVLTKENAATFPFAMLLFEFFFIRNNDKKIFRNYIIISLSVIVLISIIYLVNRSTTLTSAATSGARISSIEYLINQFVIIVKYLKLFIIPINQCSDYGSVSFNYPFILTFWRIDVIGSFLLLSGLFLFGIYLYNKNKVLSFCLFWMFLTLSVESSIIPIADPMNEHRMYLPIIGIGTFLIYSIFLLLSKIKPVYIFSLLSLIIIILGLSCYSRNTIWKNDLTLWSDVTLKAPYNGRGWLYKGITLDNLKRYEEAIKCYDESIKITPDLYRTWYNKGCTLVKLGKNEEGIVCYDEAIKLKSDNPDTWTNKGIALVHLKKYDEAIECYNNALKININDDQAWNNKGNALFHLGRFEEAIKNYEKSLELRTDNYDAWNNKGSALFSLGLLDEAIKCYNKTLELKPDYQDAINNRNVALEKLNK
jgi:protein O-mannosyl-transferase